MTLGLGTSGTSTAVSNGVVTMNSNAGTLTATTVNMGVQTNSAATDGATGTWNQNGGTAVITTLNMGNRTATTATGNVSSTYNLAAGTLKAQSIVAGGNGTGGGTVTRAFNWTGGTIQNLSGQDLTIASTNALTLNLNGGSGQKFTVDASRNIFANAAITGTGGFTKDGAGTLTLSGANTYSGGTSVSAGTLALGASNVLLSSGAVTVGGGTLSLGKVGAVCAREVSRFARKLRQDRLWSLCSTTRPRSRSRRPISTCGTSCAPRSWSRSRAPHIGI